MPTTAAAPTPATNASNEAELRGHHSMGRRTVLRGFIRKAGEGKYEGICLTLNLAVRGSSMEEVEQKLHAVIVAYLEDAVRDGNWNEFVPRRAPFSYYATYSWYVLRALLRAVNDFKLFVESAPSCPAHA